MGITWLTPSDITPGTTESWEDVDVSGSVPEGATGVIIHLTTGGTAGEIGFRKNGSTDDRTDVMYTNAHFWVGIGVDSNRVLELYVQYNTLHVYLVGYCDSDCYFHTNAVDNSLSSSNVWTDVDVSGDTPDGTAIGVFLEILGNSNLNWAVRKNGSEDDRYLDVDDHGAALIGVDGSEIYEAKVSNKATLDIFFLGYIKAGATFNTNATDLSLTSTGDYYDLTALPSGGTGGFIEVISTGWQQTFALRENGSEEDIYLNCCGENHSWGIVKADGSRLIEGKISDTGVDFFLVGYSTVVGPQTHYASGMIECQSIFRALPSLLLPAYGIISAQSEFDSIASLVKLAYGFVIGQSGLNSVLTALNFSSGCIEGASVLDGMLKSSKYSNGIITGQSELDSTLNMIGSINGTVSAQSILSAIGSIAGAGEIKYVRGIISGNSELGAILNIISSIKGGLHSQSVLSGLASLAAVGEVLYASGIIAGQSDLDAVLKLLKSMSGTIGGQSALTAILSRIFSVSGTILGESEISTLACLILNVAGVVSSTAEFDAALNVLYSVAGSLEGTSGMDAAAAIAARFQAAWAMANSDILDGIFV